MLRNSWLLAVFLALITLASAINLDGVEEYWHRGEKRQASGTGNSPTTSTAPPTSAVPTSRSPSATPTPTPTPAPSPTSTRLTSAAASSAAPSSRATTPTRTSDAASSAGPTSERTTAIIRTSALVSTSSQTFITIFTTESNGQTFEVTSTGTSEIPVTTGQATYTDPPTSQKGSSNGSGLSDSNKKVIGGVVGGIGGVLLLGGIALVFWRMKNRQSRVSADDDDLVAGTGSALGDKPASGSSNTPFQSNLEQYHNPGGRPNAAANF